jgi:hypothetical protein
MVEGANVLATLIGKWTLAGNAIYLRTPEPGSCFHPSLTTLTGFDDYPQEVLVCLVKDMAGREAHEIGETLVRIAPSRKLSHSHTTRPQSLTAKCQCEEHRAKLYHRGVSVPLMVIPGLC